MKNIFRMLLLFIFIFILCSCSLGGHPVNGTNPVEKVHEKNVKQDTGKLKNSEKAPLPIVGKKQVDAANKPMALYKGPIEHIFFHPLVVYPQLAFDGDRLAKGYNDWFVTVNEFNKIIQSLY
ncbi:MAG: hypothetical protein Q8906_07060, partial [Bacillota bacterium]|nr:hypothetical protein [Bacillota bacterium]